MERGSRPARTQHREAADDQIHVYPARQTARIENPKPGTPQTGEYAFGWGVVVDVDNDLGIMVTTNFREENADAAAGEVVEDLYRDTLGVDQLRVGYPPWTSF
jgi:hypothetical protein